MPTVLLPGSLLALFPGTERRHEVPGSTVGELLEALDGRVPGLRDRLVESPQRLRPHINVFVAGRPADLASAVAAGDTVHVIPAVSGGSSAGAPDEAGGSETEAGGDPSRDIVSWDDLDGLVATLADRLAGQHFDVLLAITRGGMVPAGMLAYRLRLRDILVAAVEFYDDEGRPGPHPTFFQFPADPLLRGRRVLVVDEVWDSGTTIHAVTERVRQAGGEPVTAVLHYKPARSVVPGRPDVHAVETDRWVVYPFKAGG